MSTSLSAALPSDLKTAQQERSSLPRPAASGTHKRELKRPGRRTILVLVAGALILAAGTYWFVSSAGYESTDDAAVEAHVIQVSPKISAHVKQVHFDENYKAKRGLLIFK